MREAESSARALSTTYTYSSGTCQCQLPSILSRVFSSKDSGRLQARPEYQTTTCDASRLGSARPRRHGRGERGSQFEVPVSPAPQAQQMAEYIPCATWSGGAAQLDPWRRDEDETVRLDRLLYCTWAACELAGCTQLPPACLSFFLYSAALPQPLDRTPQ